MWQQQQSRKSFMYLPRGVPNFFHHTQCASHSFKLIFFNASTQDILNLRMTKFHKITRE